MTLDLNLPAAEGEQEVFDVLNKKGANQEDVHGLHPHRGGIQVDIHLSLHTIMCADGGLQVGEANHGVGTFDLNIPYYTEDSQGEGEDSHDVDPDDDLNFPAPVTCRHQFIYS